MSGPRSFDELSAREVLSLAMSVERNNARRFDAFIEVFRGRDPEVEGLLHGLYEDERSHLRQLEEAWKELFGDETPPAIDEADVKEVVESVDIEDGEHEIFDRIDRDRALAAVAASERAALHFYERALAKAEDPGLKKAFERLRDLERGHLDAVHERMGKAR